MSMFQKAQKQQLKARVAFVGPTGSGKTWTALEWARTLVGPDGRIAVVDTENNSAAYYSDRFDFDVCPVGEPYEPHRLTTIIREAAKEGYDAVVVDSLSHFWEGEGGVLDIADNAGQRSGGGNSFAGWKVATPQLRNLIDVLRSVDMHVIVTMRSKMEWVLDQVERNGRTVSVPRKVGMAPVMRQGVDYEFTVVIDMNLEHEGAVTKSRCSDIADVIMRPHRAGETAETFGRWLNSGEKLATRDQLDALNEVFVTLGDPVERRAAKQAFLDRFGPPDRLPASRYDEALRWTREQATPMEATRAVEAEDLVHPDSLSWAASEPEQPKLVDTLPASDATPITSKGDTKFTPKQQREFFALWGELSAKHNWTEDDRHARIKGVTGGRTDSWAEVTQLEADQLLGDLRALKKGAA